MSSMNYQRFSFKPCTLTNKDQYEQTQPDIYLVFKIVQMTTTVPLL